MANHWETQPRDAQGRFTSGSGVNAKKVAGNLAVDIAIAGALAYGPTLAFKAARTKAGRRFIAQSARYLSK